MLVAQPLWACVVSYPTDFSDIVEADAVFVGDLADYKRIEHEWAKGEGGKTIYTHAVLTYRVHEKLRGQLPRVIEVLWYNSTFGIPEERPIGDLRIVGLSRRASNAGPPVYYLQQQPCSGPITLAATPRNVRVVKAWLDNGVSRPEELDVSSGLQERTDGPSRQTSTGDRSDRHEPDENDWAMMALMASLAIGTLAASIVAWRIVPKGD